MDDSKDIYDLTEHLTIPQKMALAKALSLKISDESAKRSAANQPGEVVHTAVFRLGEPSADAARMVNAIARKGDPG